MSKVKKKEFNAVREWNDFIWSLIQAERSWEKLSDHFRETIDIDDTLQELSPTAFRTCKTTKFRYAMDDIMRLCGVHGSVKDYIIKIKKGD